MKFISKVGAAVGSSLSVLLLVGASASAHVVVKPAEALTGSYQSFVVSAPNERDIAYTAIKLDVPEGVASVMPTAKAGWTITLDKTGEGESAVVKSITWAGNVDAGFRDEFSFSAKLPDTPTEIDWKAYQTYADGTTVSWDQKQASESDEESSTSGPLSVTKVVAQSTADNATTEAKDAADSAKQTADVALYTAIAGLVGVLVLLVYVLKRK